MLSQRDKSVIINILDEVLGVGTSLKGNEQAHHCPFCHHHKKKLQINLETQQWHCWVCDAKGRKIQTLLRKLQVDSSKIKKIYEIYGDDYIVSSTTTDEEKVELRLPSEFKSLLKNDLISLTNKSGSSRAAKCPPFFIFVHLLTLKILFTYDLGGQLNISFGNSAIAVGILIFLKFFGKGLPPSSLLPK